MSAKKNAEVINKPAVFAKKNKVKKNLSFSEETSEMLAELADADDTTMSAWLTRVIRERKMELDLSRLPPVDQAKSSGSR